MFWLPSWQVGTTVVVGDEISTKRELANKHLASLGCPATSTLLHAINCGHLFTSSGLTTALQSKNSSQSIATAFGNQNQEAKQLQSTRSPQARTLDPPDHKLAPPLAYNSNVFCSNIFATESLRSYLDQTGKFPFKSSHGNVYIFILYNYDFNSIHALTIPNCQAATICDSWQAVSTTLASKGYTATKFIFQTSCKSAMH